MVKKIQGSYSGYTKTQLGTGDYPSYSGYTTTHWGEGEGLSILFWVHHNTVGRGGGVIHPIQGTPQHSWERGRGYPSYSGYTKTQLGEGERGSILFRVHHNTVGRGGRGYPSYSGYTTTQLGQGGGVIHPIQGTRQHIWERGLGPLEFEASSQLLCTKSLNRSQ